MLHERTHHTQHTQVNHGLMEVRATTELARILSRDLGDKRQAQKRLEALFDVYQVSSSVHSAHKTYKLLQ
jgi:predicted outer membrane protein